MAVETFCTGCGERLEQQEVEGEQRLYCPVCDAVRWQNPVPVAWTLVRNGDDVLLVKRAEEPDQGLWDIPGGFLEHGESFRAAAARELDEETGVRIDPDALALYDTISFHRGERHVVGTVLEAELDAPQEIVADSDAAEARFCDLDALTLEAIRPICRPLLDHADS